MYQGIVVGDYDWVETSSTFATKEEAQAWVNETVRRNNSNPRRRDWGYVADLSKVEAA